MVTYSNDKHYAYFNGATFCRDSRTGYYLGADKCESGKRKRLHVAVWEFYNGPVPEGMHIHHVDFDKGNNEISNLMLLTPTEHMTLHSNALTETQIARMRENLINNAIPASKKWHASQEGHEWHVRHGHDAMKNRKPTAYTCDICGKTYASLRIYPKDSNHFCSNNCRAAFRRKSGADNEERKCTICGKAFQANKYLPTKTCSRECGRESRKACLAS